MDEMAETQRRASPEACAAALYYRASEAETKRRAIRAQRQPCADCGSLETSFSERRQAWLCVTDLVRRMTQEELERRRRTAARMQGAEFRQPVTERSREHEYAGSE